MASSKRIAKVRFLNCIFVRFACNLPIGCLVHFHFHHIFHVSCPLSVDEIDMFDYAQCILWDTFVISLYLLTYVCRD